MLLYKTSENPHECRLDQGGYFICNGIEKVLLAQEKLHTNQPHVFSKTAFQILFAV